MKFKKRNIQVVDHSTGQTLDFPTFGKVAGEEAITELEKNVDNKIADLKSMVGTPLKASTASAMNDSEKIYVYTGSESGYTNGHWYYNDDGVWVDGGVYNSTAVETDKTLSIGNMPADAKKTGDEVSAIKNTLSEIQNLFVYPPDNLFTHPAASRDGIFTDPSGSSASNASWGYVDIAGLTAGEKLSLAGGRHMTCFFQGSAPSTGNVIAGGADSTVDEVRTIPDSAVGVRVSFLLANRSQMAVVVSDTVVTVTDIASWEIRPSESLDVYSKEDVDSLVGGNINIVTIGTDYANLRLALEDIATKDLSYANRYLVKIPKGTYDIRSLFTSAELATTKGLFVPPFTKIQGIGNPSEVVLNWINPTVNSKQAVLNLDCTAELENLTLHGEKLRYALHDDWTLRKWDGVTPYSEYWYDAFVNKGWARTVRNCIFDVVDSPVRPAWGAGVVNGVRWLFENCTFITNKAYAGSCHNDTNFSMPCHIVFRNCIFTATDTYFLRLTSITNNANGIINQTTFEGCMNTNSLKFILTEEDASNFGRGCLWAVNGFGNAFGNAKGQISVTDGQDYSSRLKLIG